MNRRMLTAKENAVVDAMEILGVCTTAQITDVVGFAPLGSIKSLEGKGIVFKAGKFNRGWRWSL